MVRTRWQLSGSSYRFMFEVRRRPECIEGRTERMGADGRQGTGMRWLVLTPGLSLQLRRRACAEPVEAGRPERRARAFQNRERLSGKGPARPNPHVGQAECAPSPTQSPSPGRPGPRSRSQGGARRRAPPGAPPAPGPPARRGSSYACGPRRRPGRRQPRRGEYG